jgi:hypothetical protein
MKKTHTALLAVILHSVASAQIPVVGGQAAELLRAQANKAEASRARLTDTQVLLTDASPMKAKLDDCQPLKGEAVAILETRSNVDGMVGVSAAHVRVLGGQCTGLQGWVGLPRLEKVVVPAQQ